MTNGEINKLINEKECDCYHDCNCKELVQKLKEALQSLQKEVEWTVADQEKPAAYDSVVICYTVNQRNKRWDKAYIGLNNQWVLIGRENIILDNYYKVTHWRAYPKLP